MSLDSISLLDQYDYSLPPDLIAQEPADPRDSARLLVYDRARNQVHFDTFRNLATYLPPQALLVFNQTKVLPARLRVTKSTGAAVSLLFVGLLGDTITVMANRRLTTGSTLQLALDMTFTVVGQVEKYYELQPSFPIADIFPVLERYGTTPIPPYIKHSPLSEAALKEKYQTVFARQLGSVAAPTASLHFTNALLEQLRGQGFGVEFITLHVNLGTFAPVTPEHIAQGKLHEEYYEISTATAAAITRARLAGRPIVAVGTTVVRALESAVDATGNVAAGTNSTRLFIQEGYQFKVVDSLITNFHVPKSSLLMLVSALVGREKLFELYQQAIDKKFRFFSFGDGMLIK